MPGWRGENGSGGNGAIEGELGRSGSTSVVELQRVNKIRRDFVANVSHELKTPATSLKLLAESLVEILE
ncbi:MAG: two-component sensor histidine kinase, partial [Rubrobacter sp.]|nr:two-component sensor histidine kinase [Rubrobacter sp.]